MSQHIPSLQFAPYGLNYNDGKLARGRPPLTPNHHTKRRVVEKQIKDLVYMSRKRYIQIRVSNEELKEIKERAGNIDTSTFLRKLALDQQIAQPPTPSKEVIHKCDPDLIREINWIGNNINQIAKHLNEGNKLSNSVLIELLNLQTSLDEVVQRVMKDDS